MLAGLPTATMWDCLDNSQPKVFSNQHVYVCVCLCVPLSLCVCVEKTWDGVARSFISSMLSLSENSNKWQYWFWLASLLNRPAQVQDAESAKLWLTTDTEFAINSSGIRKKIYIDIWYIKIDQRKVPATKGQKRSAIGPFSGSGALWVTWVWVTSLWNAQLVYGTSAPVVWTCGMKPLHHSTTRL